MCDAHNLPFKTDTFDSIVSFEVIEHLKNPLLFLTYCRDVLKDKGRIILTTPNPLMYPFIKLLSFFGFIHPLDRKTA